MKKFDQNNFVIDHVFKALDKMYKRNEKKNNEIKQNKQHDDEECYTIEIKV